MRDLQDMTIGQRIVLTFVIVLVILFALALVGFISGRWEEAPAAPLAVSPFDQRLAELDHEALDEAYKARVQKLFEIWLADSHDQPRRALVGVANARAAYTQAMIEVEKRKPK
jgi:hypothetical protein